MISFSDFSSHDIVEFLLVDKSIPVMVCLLNHLLKLSLVNVLSQLLHNLFQTRQ